jgi:serine/threonine protein phosphatase 1
MSLLSLPENSVGKDYIVGDIHGHYDELFKLLHEINFDYTKDRLFSVGDLIDRGPDSYKCLQLIYKPWFITVQGNHEQLMYMSVLEGYLDVVKCWMLNGGEWSKNHTKAELIKISKDLKQLPYIISVGDGDTRFNIVHAEIVFDAYKYPRELSDNIIDDWSFSQSEMDSMLWGGSIRHTYKNNITTKYKLQSDMLSITYCGHTPVLNTPIQHERQIYLDTGYVFGGKPFVPRFIKDPIKYRLTIACHTDRLIYQLCRPFNIVTKTSYNECGITI